MRRLLTPGWLATHAAALVLVLGMLGLAGWQLSRATGGNALSWGYAAQWPVFAGFVVFIWFREVRRTLRGATTADSGTPRGPDGEDSSGDPTILVGTAGPVDTVGTPVRVRSAGRFNVVVDEDTDDPELAAYNRFLAWLSANPGARPVDYPG